MLDLLRDVVALLIVICIVFEIDFEYLSLGKLRYIKLHLNFRWKSKK